MVCIPLNKETHTVFVVFAGKIRNENDISEYLLWGEHSSGWRTQSQIVLRSIISMGMSKPADETSEGVVGYSLLH